MIKELVRADSESKSVVFYGCPHVDEDDQPHMRDSLTLGEGCVLLLCPACMASVESQVLSRILAATVAKSLERGNE